MYSRFVDNYQAANLPLPTQDPDQSKAHRLDCAFFDYAVRAINLSSERKVETIRAVFVEGENIYPNSAIYDLAHVQIAVRNIRIDRRINNNQYQWCLSMSLNPQEIGQILTKHFDELTPEKFIENLKEVCPYIFDARSTQPEDRNLPPDNSTYRVDIDKTGSPAETLQTVDRP